MAQQNIALNKPTSASSFVKPYESARAVNGTYGSATPTSRWLCNTLPGWMMVDLGVNGSNPYWINRWVVRHMSVAGWQSPTYNMCDFKLQGSNDRNAWYDIDSVVGNTIGITDRTLVTAVAYRYVRLYVTKGLQCNTRMASAMEFEVYQSPPLSAYLISGTGLTVSAGALSPAFVNNVFNYTTPNVANSVTSVAVKPTAEDSRATIKVNGVVVTSGNSTNVALNVGSNAISVVVTAADGMTTNTYTVTVVREATAYLTNLSLATTATPSVAVPYTPTPFDKDTTAYSASVGYDVSQIVVTPTTDIVGATITVNTIPVTGTQPSATVNLTAGQDNVITVQVTSGSATKNYTITVKKSSNTQLKNLMSTRPVTPPLPPPPSVVFNPNQYTYTGSVASSVPDITLTPTLQDAAATLTVEATVTLNGNVSNLPITPVGSGYKVTLNSGTNTINIKITPVFGSVKGIYTVTITKP